MQRSGGEDSDTLGADKGEPEEGEGGVVEVALEGQRNTRAELCGEAGGDSGRTGGEGGAWAEKAARAVDAVRGKFGSAVGEESAATAAGGKQEEEDPDGDAVFCTDGSGGHAKEKGLRRCGWAYACIAKGEMVHFVAGPLPGEHQSVPRAELYALVALLESTAGARDCRYGVTMPTTCAR